MTTCMVRRALAGMGRRCEIGTTFEAAGGIRHQLWQRASKQRAARQRAEDRGQRIEGRGQGQGAGFFRTMDAEREPAREKAAVDGSFSLTNRSEA